MGLHAKGTKAQLIERLLAYHEKKNKKRKRRGEEDEDEEEEESPKKKKAKTDVSIKADDSQSDFVSLGSFPVEVLANIFCHVDGVSLVRFSGVCKKWYTAVNAEAFQELLWERAIKGSFLVDPKELKETYQDLIKAHTLKEGASVELKFKDTWYSRTPWKIHSYVKTCNPDLTWKQFFMHLYEGACVSCGNPDGLYLIF